MKKILRKISVILGISALMAAPTMASSNLNSMPSQIQVRLTEDISLVDFEGNTYPVYEVVNLGDSKSSSSTDNVQTVKNDIYEHFSWTIRSNKQSETNSFYLWKGDKLYINDVKWDAGKPIHLGISTGSKNYYSNLSSGSFNGYLTSKESNSFSFYIKNVGYDTISAQGFITGYPW